MDLDRDNVYNLVETENLHNQMDDILHEDKQFEGMEDNLIKKYFEWEDHIQIIQNVYDNDLLDFEEKRNEDQSSH